MKHIYYSQVCGSEATLFFVWDPMMPQSRCTLCLYLESWGKSALGFIPVVQNSVPDIWGTRFLALWCPGDTLCSWSPLTWPAPSSQSAVLLKAFSHATLWLPSGSTAAATAKSLQSRPTLCNPIDGSPPGSSVYGILQARTLEWSAIPFFRGSSWPRDWT